MIATGADIDRWVEYIITLVYFLLLPLAWLRRRRANEGHRGAWQVRLPFSCLGPRFIMISGVTAYSTVTGPRVGTSYIMMSVTTCVQIITSKSFEDCL